jgi:hypothetical protein
MTQDFCVTVPRLGNLKTDFSRPHRAGQARTEAESVGVVEVLVPGQSAGHRLPRKGGQAVASILSGAWVLEFTGGLSREVEGVVKFAVGQESGVAGDLGPEEAEPETAVESGSERLGLAVTPQKALSRRQETSENSGKPEVIAHVLCQTRGLIWEIRD